MINRVEENKDEDGWTRSLDDDNKTPSAIITLPDDNEELPIQVDIA